MLKEKKNRWKNSSSSNINKNIKRSLKFSNSCFCCCFFFGCSSLWPIPKIISTVSIWLCGIIISVMMNLIVSRLLSLLDKISQFIEKGKKIKWFVYGNFYWSNSHNEQLLQYFVSRIFSFLCPNSSH